MALPSLGFFDLLKSPFPSSVEEPDIAFELILPGAATLRLFGESWSYPCVPLVGVYSDEAYDPALPMAILGIPLIDCAKQLPPKIAEHYLRALSLDYISPGQTELYFLIHSTLETSKCEEFNLMLHPWAFADDGVADSNKSVGCWLLM